MNPDATKSSDDPAEERRKAFRDALAVTHQEHTAKLIEDTVEAQKRGFAALMDGLDFVEKFDATDPVRARLIDAYKQGMLRLGAALGKAEGKPQGPVEETLNSPFSGSSMSSSMASQEPLTPSSALDSDSQHRNRSLPEPPKRGPGRPKGTKNKPQSEQ